VAQRLETVRAVRGSIEGQLHRPIVRQIDRAPARVAEPDAGRAAAAAGLGQFRAMPQSLPRWNFQPESSSNRSRGLAAEAANKFKLAAASRRWTLSRTRADVVFIGRKLFNVGRESNKTARRINSTGRWQKAPAHPQAMIFHFILQIHACCALNPRRFHNCKSGVQTGNIFFIIFTPANGMEGTHGNLSFCSFLNHSNLRICIRSRRKKRRIS